MAKKVSSNEKITHIQIRMYRCGTGDFFVLLFNKGDRISFKVMVDCGCIHAGKADFLSSIKDLGVLTGKNIDLLVVTHQHADHINGFEKCADLFDSFTFKKVWFAWTEDDTDPTANNLRAYHCKMGLGINKAVTELNNLIQNPEYSSLFSKEIGGELMFDGKKHFIQSLTDLSNLIPTDQLGVSQMPPTMVQLLKNYNIIKSETIVEYLEPGEILSNLLGTEGIRFIILGPPRDINYLNMIESEGETYDKREDKSSIDFSFLSAIASSISFSTANLPFESEFETSSADIDIQELYNNKDNWRKIDHDWLFSAGKLALQYERSVNNTSLVIGIQFEESEKVLLFAADAEIGNWESWHNNLEWQIKVENQIIKKKVDYFLNNTVFYKVGHHLSQNGTAKGKGIDMMIDADLTSMASLDFKKINTGWLKTMPNDLLGAELIRKTKGKLLFSGDYEKILQNIKTDRVFIKKEHEKTLIALNEKFKGKNYVDFVVNG
jgi:hypothetical protein